MGVDVVQLIPLADKWHLYSCIQWKACVTAGWASRCACGDVKLEEEMLGLYSP